PSTSGTNGRRERRRSTSMAGPPGERHDKSAFARRDPAPNRAELRRIGRTGSPSGEEVEAQRVRETHAGRGEDSVREDLDEHGERAAAAGDVEREVVAGVERDRQHEGR